MSSMFNESMPTKATPAATSASQAAAVRYGLALKYFSVRQYREKSVRTSTAFPPSHHSAMRRGRGRDRAATCRHLEGIPRAGEASGHLCQVSGDRDDSDCLGFGDGLQLGMSPQLREQAPDVGLDCQS